MRTTLTAVSALALLAMATPASAADVYSSSKDPIVATVMAPSSWTGFYAGVNGGYGQNVDSLNTTLWRTFPPSSTVIGTPVTGPDVSGFWFGGQAGYLWQVQGGGLVLGAELAFDGTSMTGDATAKPAYWLLDGVQLPPNGSYSTTMHQQLDWVIAPTAIVGYSFGSIMPFVKGGPAFGHVQESLGLFNGTNNIVMAAREATDNGWTAGGGVAYKSGPVVFSIDYNYYDFGDHNVSKTYSFGENSNAIATAKNHETYETILAHISYQFNGGGYQSLK